MAKVRFAKKAVEDLTQIYHYSFSLWGEVKAYSYSDRIISFCNLLAKNGKNGKTYEEITPDLLGAKALNQIIFYRILSDKEIEIIRIIGEIMDFKRYLK